MTHNDILNKFKVEYDKADIASSFPSLTDYEIATVLDKAYLAIIAQKVTGNNQRRVQFEYDTKAIEDLRPLITSELKQEQSDNVTIYSKNEHVYQVPDLFLYFVSAQIESTDAKSNKIVNLVNHNMAQKYKLTDSNYPWVKDPVCYMEDTNIHVLVDADVDAEAHKRLNLRVTYIKKPNSFVSNVKVASTTTFELSETMAEELINLAIAMSLEIVESTRLNTKLQTLPLES